MADDFQNLVVGDDDQAVDIFLELLQTFLGLDHADVILRQSQGAAVGADIVGVHIRQFAGQLEGDDAGLQHNDLTAVTMSCLKT